MEKTAVGEREGSVTNDNHIVASDRDVVAAEGEERGERGDAGAVADVARVVEDAHVDAHGPHLAPREDAEALDVERAPLAHRALDDARDVRLPAHDGRLQLVRRRRHRRVVHEEREEALARPLGRRRDDLRVRRREAARVAHRHLHHAVAPGHQRDPHVPPHQQPAPVRPQPVPRRRKDKVALVHALRVLSHRVSLLLLSLLLVFLLLLRPTSTHGVVCVCVCVCRKRNQSLSRAFQKTRTNKKKE